MDTFEAFAAARFSPGITADGVALVEDRLVPGGRAIAKRASTPLERAALVREVELSTSLALDAAPAVLAFVVRTEHATVYFERASGVSIGEARLTSRELQEVAVDLLEALGAAHDRGFVHGDLKPEHVIVEVDRGAPKVRLIDWGLAAPLGSPARGGSHGYLAPELLEGAPAGIATDLYAFGATMRPAIHSDDAAARALRALCDQCVAAPSDRPTSVWAALAMIGIVRPDPGARRTAPLPGPIDEDPIGQSFSVEGPSGSGRTHFVQRAVRHAIARRRPIVGLRCEAGYDPIQWIADVLGFHVSIDAERRASRAGTLLGRMGVTLVLDDVDHLDEDGVVSASAAARAIRAESNGRVLYVGPGELLAAELVAAGASRIALEPLGARETESMLEDVGARSDDATVREVMRATHGLAGHVGRIALALGRSPELGVDDALAHAIPPVDSRRGLEAIDSIAMARGLITRAPRRAATILRNAAIEPGDAAERDRLLAQAEMSSGRLRAAETIYAELVMKAAPSERARAELDHARVLERLGRHVDARASALRALGGDDVEIHGDAAVIAAQSTLALGDPTGAAQLAGRGLEVARDAVVRARLHALVSDATLRTHRLEEALVAATAAVAEARRSNDPAASAHAAARVAAAHGLSGNPAGAREAWADALRNAEAASDVTALPPFVMNLATADHAMGEYGAARDGYSRAAHLAERLGRTASLASALTNLGGLLASLSSFEEARAVLGRARTAASSAGAKLFEAQCDLLEAETWVLE
ncbi:MAG: hypothetical protein HOW73_13940, partial [Polyangiaceae bacterium]|nr:hypothetical protein [Polyangiaceae bacterium]